MQLLIDVGVLELRELPQPEHRIQESPHDELLSTRSARLGETACLAVRERLAFALVTHAAIAQAAALSLDQPGMESVGR